MNPEQREQVRLSLLRYGLSGRLTVGLAHQYLKSEGHPVKDQEEVKAEIWYLEEKGLMAMVPQAVSPEVKHYRTSAAGRDYLAEQGF